MNLYQTLNQDLRAFRMKQSLLEAEEVKPEVNEEVTTETEEAPVEECVKTEADESSQDVIDLEARVNEIDNRLKSIDDALNNAADDEKEELIAERNALVAELDQIDASIRTEGDCCCCEDKDDDEVTEDVVEEPIEEVTEEVPAEEVAEEPAEDLKDSEVSPEAIVNELIQILEEEKGIDPELALDKLKELKELLAPSVEAEEESLTECEVKSFKVVRMAPTCGAYMIEAQTTEGVKYITGRNYNESEKTLDEAEIAENKSAAANRFKSLLANK